MKDEIQKLLDRSKQARSRAELAAINKDDRELRKILEEASDIAREATALAVTLEDEAKSSGDYKTALEAYKAEGRVRTDEAVVRLYTLEREAEMHMKAAANASSLRVALRRMLDAQGINKEAEAISIELVGDEEGYAIADAIAQYALGAQAAFAAKLVEALGRNADERLLDEIKDLARVARRDAKYSGLPSIARFARRATDVENDVYERINANRE